MAVERTLAERSARVECWFSADLGSAVPPVDAPMLDVISQGFRETGCIDFAERRSRLGDEYERVVANGVEYTRIAPDRWRSQSLESGAWPPLHPCWFVEGLASSCRAGRQRADGRLDLELDPAIVPQMHDPRPAWTEAAGALERDEAGRAVQLTVRVSAPADNAWCQFDVELRDFGAPCHANPPPPEETVTSDEWLRSLMEPPPDG